MANSATSTSAPIGEWLLATLVSVNLVWTTLCLGGVLAETMVVSFALTGIVLIWQLVALAWTGQRSHPASLWFLPFLVYAAVNVAIVSPVPWLGKRDWLNWAQIVAVFWVSLNGLHRPGPRALVLLALLVLGGVGAALAAYQKFLWPDWLMMGRTQADQYLGRSAGFFGNPNSFGAFLVLLIPPMLALSWQRGASAVQRILCGYLAAVLLLGLGLSISRGCFLGLAGAIACWPLFARTQDWAARILWSVTACGAALLVGIVVYTAAPSIKARFDSLTADRGERSRPILWQASGQMLAEAPVLGTGGGSFNTLFERYRPERFNDEPHWTHNEYLNTLSDYGIVGFILSFGVAAGLACNAALSQRPRLAESNHGWLSPEVGAALGIGLLAFALACLVDFHLKIPALGMAVGLVGAEVLRRNWPHDPIPGLPGSDGPQAGQIVHAVMAVVAFIGLLALPLPSYQAEAARKAGRNRIDGLATKPNPSLNLQREVLTEARARFAEALALDENNAQAWADSAYASALWSRLAPHRSNELGREGEAAARKALEQSQAVFEFWIRLGVSLDMQGRWSEGSSAFIRALQLAPSSPLAWYHQAYHLSLTPRGRDLAIASVETCLRLDPHYGAAKALRQRLTSTP